MDLDRAAHRSSRRFWSLLLFVLEPLEPSGSGGLSAHDLRHTAGAIASKSGMHPMAVKEMMGHSSIKVTYDVYGHLFPTMHEAGIGAVEAAYRIGRGTGEAAR